MVKPVFKKIGLMVSGVALCLALTACSLNDRVSSYVENPPVIETPPVIEYTKHLFFKKGQIVSIDAYCRYTDFQFKKFVWIVEKAGMDGYTEIITKEGEPCFDATLLNDVSIIRGMLLKVLGKVVTPNGERLEIWLFKDIKGDLGFSWVLLVGQEV